MSALDPFALGGIHAAEDAEILAAWAEIRFLLDDASEEDEDDAALARRWERIGKDMEVLNARAPATLAGCVAKLRFLCDPEIGMEAGDREDDVPSLRQILAFLETSRLAEQSDGTRTVYRKEGAA
jgi:hypothetical protein